MQDDTIELRQPTDDAESLRSYMAPIAAAFGEGIDDAEFDADRSVWEVDRFIGAVEGERWVGGGAAYSFRLTVPGRREIGAAGITGIGVSPDYRRRGILTRMMRWILDQAAERGEPVAVLHASEGAIYPHFGFGLATLQGSFDCERSYFRFARPAEPLGRVRLVEVDEAMGIVPDLYDAVRHESPGAVSRSAAKWRAQMLADGGPIRAKIGSKYRAVLEVEGRPRGYALYRMKADWDERGPRNQLTTMEVIGLDPAAERALWEWLAGIDLVGRIKGWRAPVSHPLLLQLEDIARLGFVVGDGIWLRIIDLPAALEGRSYEGSGVITLEVTDAFVPANAGRWRVEVTDGGATVSATEDAPDLTLDTADLASAYLGGFSFGELFRAGRVGPHREGAIADADRLFWTNNVAWCSTPF
ncbi:MAG: GNAT family N-acetyltransferase [Chloroflexota bacterium]